MGEGSGEEGAVMRVGGGCGGAWEEGRRGGWERRVGELGGWES